MFLLLLGCCSCLVKLRNIITIRFLLPLKVKFYNLTQTSHVIYSQKFFVVNRELVCHYFLELAIKFHSFPLLTRQITCNIQEVTRSSDVSYKHCLQKGFSRFTYISNLRFKFGDYIINKN